MQHPGDNGHWTYRSGDMGLSFGLQGEVSYGISGVSLVPVQQLLKAANPIPADVSRMIVGERMAMVLNVKVLVGNSVAGISMFDIVKPIINNVKVVVCVMKFKNK